MPGTTPGRCIQQADTATGLWPKWHTFGCWPASGKFIQPTTVNMEICSWAGAVIGFYCFCCLEDPVKFALVLCKQVSESEAHHTWAA